MLSVPLQLFPAVRIMENGLFVRSGKTSTRVKWLKNFFRFFVVIVTSLISWAGAADLDKFVAFVGCFAWQVSVCRFSSNHLMKLLIPVFRCVTCTQLCCTTRPLRVLELRN